MPELEIALYEYGNDGLNMSDGYIRMVAPLATDLDLISEELFKLTTNGGSEYCGWVIRSATEELNWSKDPNVLKLIFIAGNEPFSQGSVDHEKACRDAIAGGGIMVNTIFCGNFDEGVRTYWKKGVDLADGKYFNITKELPQEMQEMTLTEKENFVSAKAKERQEIQEKIKALDIERRKYIAAKQRERSDDGTLDSAIIKALREQAAEKNYRFD